MKRRESGLVGSAHTGQQECSRSERCLPKLSLEFWVEVVGGWFS